MKLRYIRELNSKLGIVHSNIEGVVISRKTVEKIDAYLLKEESTISDVFNLKIINNDKKNRTLKKNIELLNTGMKIASNSKDHKIVNEFITQSHSQNYGNGLKTGTGKNGKTVFNRRLQTTEMG